MFIPREHKTCPFGQKIELTIPVKAMQLLIGYFASKNRSHTHVHAIPHAHANTSNKTKSLVTYL